MAVLDILLLLGAFFVIGGIIFLATTLKNRDKIDGILARKVVHVGIGFLVIFAPLLFSSKWYPVSLGIVATVFSFLTSPISPKREWRLSAFREGNNYGTILYSISLTSLLYLFFEDGWIIQVAFLPLVFGDAAANIFGIRYGRHKWPGGTKSVQGSIAGGISSFVMVFLVLVLYSVIGKFPGVLTTILLISIGVAILMPAIEIISPMGSDNLTIPLSCVLLALFVNQQFTLLCDVLYCFS